MAQHYYPLSWGWGMLGREMGQAAGASVARGKQGGRWDVLGSQGKSRGMAPPQCHEKLSKLIARQK